MSYLQHGGRATMSYQPITGQLIALLVTLLLLSFTYPVAHRYVDAGHDDYDIHPREILAASSSPPLITASRYERATPVAGPSLRGAADGRYNPSSIVHDNDGGVIGMSPWELRVEYRLADPKLTRDLPMGLDMTHPRFSWKLSEPSNGERGVIQTAYQIRVHNRHSHALVWDSQRVISSDSIHVRYDGSELESDNYYTFQVRYWDNAKRQSQWSKGMFHMGLLHQHNFANISWIGHSTIVMNEMRREFTIGSDIVKATAYVSGIGYYSFELNGAAVDATRRLDPGWTPYHKRVLYATYDVADQLQVGANCIGIALGNGWYTPDQYLYPASAPPSYVGGPRLWFTMNITTVSNGTIHIVSDTHWHGRQGSITWDSVYGGEHRDARLDRPGWSKPGFVDKLSLWAPVEFVTPPGGVLASQQMEPIRVVQQLPPVKVWQPSNALNTFAVDFGQNFAGWVRVKVQGARGRSVHIRYAEILEQPSPSATGGLYNGDFPYFDNLRGAAQTDVYVFRGDPDGEWYEPTFTVHGFRYMLIQDTGAPSSATCIGMVVRTAAPKASSFITNNPIINQINSAVVWGQASNLMSIPTDCPQRDERKGWMGDASLTVDEALFNFKLAPFYYHFLDQVQLSQGQHGEIPDTVPFTFGREQGDPSWGSAYNNIVMNLYNHNGDKGIMTTHYPYVKKWADFLYSQANASTLAKMYTWYGDWVPPPPAQMCNGALVASFSTLRTIHQISEMATILNQPKDKKHYDQLYASLATEFHTTFYKDGGYGEGYQACNILALALPNVVPANLQQSVLQNVIDDITVVHNHHLTTGIIGTKALLEVLSDMDRNDIAVTLATQTTYPSWGYMITNPSEPATTLWELWNAPSQGPEMNSRNHIMYGSVGGWFHRTLAGINPNGFSPILIRPRMSASHGNAVMYVKDTYESLLGDISVTWQFGSNGEDTTMDVFTLDVTLPANSRAIVHLPTQREFGRTWKSVSESDRVLCHRSSTAIISAADDVGSSLMNHCVTNTMDTAITMGITDMQLDGTDDHIMVHVVAGSYSFTLA